MASTTPIPAAGLTPYSFAVDVLQGIGAPVDERTVGFVEAWEAKEGGNWNNTARFNPLNTSLAEPGATPYKPGANVKAYTSWAQGIGATLSTLLEPAYNGVVAALRGDDPTSALDALKASPWDESHYASGFPTSAAGAAYANAHSGASGGGGGFFSTIGNALGDLTNPIQGGVDLVTHPLSGVAGDVAKGVTAGLGAVTAPLFASFKDFAITLAFAGLGIGLIAIGGYQTVKPATTRIKTAATNVATVAAAAA